MSPLPNLYPWGTDWIPLPLFEPSLIFFNTPLFTCMTRKTFGKKSLDTFIFVSPRVKSANHPLGLSSAKLCPWPNATDVV